MNRKRVQRLMRGDNLLCVAKRKFVVTTDSAHPLPVYPNLPPAMELNGINQLWLTPYTGFLHKPQPGKASLLFDLIEEFRAPAVDRVVFSMLNQGIERRGCYPESSNAFEKILND